MNLALLDSIFINKNILNNKMSNLNILVSFDVASNVASTKKKLMIKLKNIHDYESKAEQLKIIICLLNERDIILFTKTKYEKSMILYSSSTLQMNTIILLIMFLNALQKNQKNFIKKMNSNIDACVFNEKTITKKLLIEIKYEIYIHILINSEFALFNDSFREVLQSFNFRERLIFVAIDEIHLVKNRNNWRLDYERLDEMRNILSRIVFFFATSAILRDQLTAQLVDILRFNIDVKIIKKFVDRKDLFFSIQQTHHFSFFNFEDLRFSIFVFDVNTSLIKIIVYEDFINNLVQMKEALILFYIKVEATSNQVNQAIRDFNEKMFETKIFKIYENFMQKNSAIRIFCVIDVMKLNMNILDVNIIIQWKKSFNMQTLMQRVDRVVRKSDCLDEFIWFHLVWCKEEKAVMSTRDSEFNQLR
jgi:superfamily II DNA helicase RecQ